MNIFGVNGSLVLSATMLKIESGFLALARRNKILINTGVYELMNFRHRDDTGLVSDALIREEFLEILIMHKLIAVLGSCSSRSSTGPLVLEHGCDTKVFNAFDSASIWARYLHLASIGDGSVGILKGFDCANWFGEAHITESKCR